MQNLNLNQTCFISYAANKRISSTLAKFVFGSCFFFLITRGLSLSLSLPCVYRLVRDWQKKYSEEKNRFWWEYKEKCSTYDFICMFSYNQTLGFELIWDVFLLKEREKSAFLEVSTVLLCNEISHEVHWRRESEFGLSFSPFKNLWVGNFFWGKNT